MPPMEPPRPPIYSTFVTYCVVAALAQVFFAGMGLLALWMSTNPLAHVPGGDMRAMAAFCKYAGWLLLSISTPRTVLHGIGPVLPRRAWVWRFNMAMVGIGCVGPLFFLAVPISREWGTPGVMRWYGVTVPPDGSAPPPQPPAPPV
ncbi:MAG TPA: hypothetical protein VL860_11090 [Planctomycetota bacterium]|nr:hypothetical protein [Planctomycetota bacterium]